MFEMVLEKIYGVDSGSNFGDFDISYRIWLFLNNFMLLRGVKVKY